jgi:hypothetical protein
LFFVFQQSAYSIEDAAAAWWVLAAYAFVSAFWLFTASAKPVTQSMEVG